MAQMLIRQLTAQLRLAAETTQGELEDGRPKTQLQQCLYNQLVIMQVLQRLLQELPADRAAAAQPVEITDAQINEQVRLLREPAADPAAAAIVPCPPSKVARYTGQRRPRCNDGRGCPVCLAKYQRVRTEEELVAEPAPVAPGDSDGTHYLPGTALLCPPASSPLDALVVSGHLDAASAVL